MATKAWSTGNTQGVLGTGDTIAHSSPTDLAGSLQLNYADASASSGAAAAHGLGLSGEVYVWGDNTAGQLGTGSTDASAHSTPTQLTSSLFNPGVSRLERGSNNVYALCSNGDLIGWGDNQNGLMAQGDFTTPKAPVLVASGVANFSSSFGTVIVLYNDGSVHTVGVNNDGQLANGSSGATTNVFGTVSAFTGTAKQVATDGNTTYILLTDGTVIGMGDSHLGQLGFIGGFVNTTWQTLPFSSVDWIFASFRTIYAKLNDGTVWVLGTVVAASGGPSTATPIPTAGLPTGVTLQYIAHGGIASTGARTALGSDWVVYDTGSTAWQARTDIAYAGWVGGMAALHFADVLTSPPASRSRNWAAVIG